MLQALLPLPPGQAVPVRDEHGSVVGDVDAARVARLAEDLRPLAIATGRDFT